MGDFLRLCIFIGDAVMSSVEWDVHPIYKIYSVGFLGVVFYSLR